MINWDDHPREAIAPVRPAVRSQEDTDLATFEVHGYAITRTFRSRAPGLPGEAWVHAWAEDDGVGFVVTREDSEEPWLQYVLDARCASLRRHDERAVPGAVVDLHRMPWGAP